MRHPVGQVVAHPLQADPQIRLRLSVRQAQEAAIRELEAESARIMEIIRKSARAGQRGPILTLRNGALYSFWTTPDASGASHGYVAAGGPGFTGPTDTTGSGAAPK